MGMLHKQIKKMQKTLEKREHIVYNTIWDRCAFFRMRRITVYVESIISGSFAQA
jgi:hypothetical protein